MALNFIIFLLVNNPLNKLTLFTEKTYLINIMLKDYKNCSFNLIVNELN